MKNLKVILVQIVLLLLMLILIITLSVFGFYIKPNKLIISEQKIIINQLELRIEQFKRNCRWAKVLEQTLPLLAQRELDLMEEQIEQKTTKVNILKHKKEN